MVFSEQAEAKQQIRTYLYSHMLAHMNVSDISYGSCDLLQSLAARKL